MQGVERLGDAMQLAGGAPALQLLSLGKNGIGPRLPCSIITPSLRTLNVSNNKCAIPKYLPLQPLSSTESPLGP